MRRIVPRSKESYVDSSKRQNWEAVPVDPRMVIRVPLPDPLIQDRGNR